MKLKLANKVSYKGGNVDCGLIADTNQHDIRQMKPLETTYIWAILERPNDGDLYIIQHEEGLSPQFFRDYIHSFEGLNINKLHNDKKYIYTFENTLTSLEPIIEPTVKKPEGINVIQLDDEMNVDLNGYSEQSAKEQNKPEVEKTPITEYVVEEQRESTPLDFTQPYFTSQTCSEANMIEAVALSKVLWSKKMTEPFMVESASGEQVKGRAGDFLMLTQEKNVFIEPKETFGYLYEYKREGISKMIGKQANSYSLNTEVVEYIDFLEKENTRLRTDLYIKENPTQNY